MIKLLLSITIASYYSTGLEGSKTSSGERFTNNALTAAHKTLPFGTLVLVTNLANKKSVIVRINDRGPFKPGRDIDLSQKSFKSIADLKSGLIKVEYKVLKE